MGIRSVDALAQQAGFLILRGEDSACENGRRHGEQSGAGQTQKQEDEARVPLAPAHFFIQMHLEDVLKFETHTVFHGLNLMVDFLLEILLGILQILANLADVLMRPGAQVGKLKIIDAHGLLDQGIFLGQLRFGGLQASQMSGHGVKRLGQRVPIRLAAAQSGGLFPQIKTKLFLGV